MSELQKRSSPSGTRPTGWRRASMQTVVSNRYSGVIRRLPVETALLLLLRLVAVRPAGEVRKLRMELANDIAERHALGFGPEHDLITAPLDFHLGALETIFLGQPHRLAAAVFEELRRRHSYRVYLRSGAVKSSGGEDGRVAVWKDAAGEKSPVRRRRRVGILRRLDDARSWGRRRIYLDGTEGGRHGNGQLRVCRMDPNVNQNSVSLPDGLRRQFTALERRLWRIETVAAVSSAGVGLLASCLGLFLSDRLWDSPVWWRVLISLAGTAAWVGAAAYWSKHWLFKRRDLRALANLVQAQYRRLGDRLLGIVELTQEEHHTADFSPALYRAAIHQVATEAFAFDFTKAVRARLARRLVWTIAGLLALALLPALLVPAAAWNAVQRWALPMAHIQRFTLVTLDGLPADRIVPHGEPFAVSCAVGYRSFWRPTGAVARFARQPKIGSPVQARNVTLPVPGQVERGVLTLRLGDAEQRVVIHPTYRPSLRELTASIQLPDYLQYPELIETIQSGSLTVLEGSSVAFRGKANRKLAAARLQVDANEPEPLQLQGDGFSSSRVSLEDVSHCTFDWQDRLGLTNGSPWRLAIQPVKDAAPVPDLPDFASEIAILETDVLEVNAVAKDDFGVKELGLRWELVGGGNETNHPAPGMFKAQTSSPQEKQLARTFRFSPAVLQIPADSTVELRATATDFFPGRPPAESTVYRVHVLGGERHAEFIRQRLESLLVQLEEVTRLEEKITEETRALTELPKEQLEAQQTGQQLGELKDTQAQNAANLAELAREGTRTLQEAMRNPTISSDTLREWSNNLQTMQQLAQQQMREAAQSLQSAQQKAAARPPELARALAKEEEVMQALERMQRKVNQNLDQLQALTLAQRLRKLGASEKDIAGQLRKLVPATVGLLPRDLPVRFQRVNDDLVGDQDGTRKESRVLQSELSRFSERTQLENYGKVSKEMAEMRTGEELERLRDLIRENVSMEAMRGLGQWAKRFNDWASILEPKQGSASAGAEGGGGEGGQAVDLTPHLIALLRLREGELNLREQTGLADLQSEMGETYRAVTAALLAGQQQLGEGLGNVQKANPVPALGPPLEETAESMRQVASLLKLPQTDKATERAETRTIDLLTDVVNLINELAQRGGGAPNPEAEDMAFLMRLMAQQRGLSLGMNAGAEGGGNLAGGTTDRRPPPATGEANSKASEARKISRTGARGQNLPMEFREALESYFNEIE
jgi:hypothetical protein